MGQTRTATGADLGGPFWLVFACAVVIVFGAYIAVTEGRPTAARRATSVSAVVALGFLAIRWIQFQSGVETPFGHLGPDSVGFELRAGGLWTVIGFATALVGALAPGAVGRPYSASDPPIPTRDEPNSVQPRPSRPSDVQQQPMPSPIAKGGTTVSLHAEAAVPVGGTGSAPLSRRRRAVVNRTIGVFGSIAAVLVAFWMGRRHTGAPQSAPAQSSVAQQGIAAPGRLPARNAPSATSEIPAPILPLTVTVPGESAWVNTGIRLAEGDQVSIDASGAIVFDPTLGDSGIARPQGRWLVSMIPDTTGFPLKDIGIAALIARIADHTYEVGTHADLAAPDTGYLFLGINDRAGQFADNRGAFQVQVQLIRARR